MKNILFKHTITPKKNHHLRFFNLNYLNKCPFNIRNIKLMKRKKRQRITKKRSINSQRMAAEQSTRTTLEALSKNSELNIVLSVCFYSVLL